jgi:uncharacterized protein (TIGR03083 family)
MSTIAAEFLALADALETQPESGWDAPSLCDGWRVREVVAHMTMPVRYGTDQFMAELQDCGGDFTVLSNRVAARDATLPRADLLANLRDDTLHQWTPPGGGAAGALNHVVVHGLDITVPLGLGRLAADDTARSVLDDLATGRTHERFGVDLDGLQLQATDLDWGYGSGTPVTGTAADLILRMSGRELG